MLMAVITVISSLLMAVIKQQQSGSVGLFL